MQIYKIKLNDNIEYFYSYDILSMEELIKICKSRNIEIIDTFVDNEMFVQYSDEYKNILIVDAKCQILSVDHKGYCSGQEGYEEDEEFIEEKNEIIIIEKDKLEVKYYGCTSGGSGYCKGFYTKYKIIDYKDLTTPLTNELSKKAFIYCQDKWNKKYESQKKGLQKYIDQKFPVSKKMYENSKKIIEKVKQNGRCFGIKGVIEYDNARKIIQRYNSV